jgi:hypothetical protein
MIGAKSGHKKWTFGKAIPKVQSSKKGNPRRRQYRDQFRSLPLALCLIIDSHLRERNIGDYIVTCANFPDYSDFFGLVNFHCAPAEIPPPAAMHSAGAVV